MPRARSPTLGEAQLQQTYDVGSPRPVIVYAAKRHPNPDLATAISTASAPHPAPINLFVYKDVDGGTPSVADEYGRDGLCLAVHCIDRAGAIRWLRLGSPANASCSWGTTHLCFVVRVLNELNDDSNAASDCVKLVGLLREFGADWDAESTDTLKRSARQEAALGRWNERILKE